MRYRHQLRIRYGEVDRQQVVFNAHYLTYSDDAFTRWMDHLGHPANGEGWDGGAWDCMVVRSELSWAGSAAFDDALDIDCSVVRWGTTSFVLGFEMSVEGRPVCRVETTYVGVRSGTKETAPPPAAFRDALGPAVETTDAS